MKDVIRSVSKFIDLNVDIQLFQYHCVKETILLHYIAFSLLSNIH